MKFFPYIIFILLFISCRSPEQSILGKWKVVRVVERGEEILSPKEFVMDFRPDGKLIYYVNDSIDRMNGSNLYEIKGDSLIITTVRVILDGLDTRRHGYVFEIYGDVLSIERSNLYYHKFVNTDSDSSALNDLLKEDICLLPRNPKKDVRNFMSNKKPEYWKAHRSGSSIYPFEIKFDSDELIYHYIGKYTYHYQAQVTSDSTIDVYWGYDVGIEWPKDSIDTTLSRHIIDPSHGSKYPEEHKFFATYVLKDDTTFFVHYYYPEWISKVNRLSKDSLFPQYFYFVGEK